ncbi:MAG TPA: ATP-binding cassette domain-containing protein [Candidatus Handelsmanbacteria bacterium]|nr:ATP-binding cassette domain-containing protein [Candidatus Handelsmanbacteria bacterium]
MIELKNLHKRLGGRDILKGLSVKVPKGMNFVLMGPSGTGKSVTLKHVIGIFKPDLGSVHVDGKDVPAMDRKQLMALRKRMGYLFQNGALINWLSVADNVALPLKEHSRLSRSEVDDRVHEVLKLVGMDHAGKQEPPEISGGMKLRAGLARALVTNPEYVLYDEPNAGLEPQCPGQPLRQSPHTAGVVGRGQDPPGTAPLGGCPQGAAGSGYRGSRRRHRSLREPPRRCRSRFDRRARGPHAARRKGPYRRVL